MNINMLFFDGIDTDESKLLRVNNFEAVGKLCADIEQGRLTNQDIANYLYEVSKVFHKAEHSRKTKEGIRKSKERKAKELAEQAKNE